MTKLKRIIINIAFNRPQYLEQVLDGIRAQHLEPEKYDYVAFVDGPRNLNKGDNMGISENLVLIQKFMTAMTNTFNAATVICRDANVGVDVNVLDALYQVFVNNHYDEEIGRAHV
jgi:hypothetical protein